MVRDRNIAVAARAALAASLIALTALLAACSVPTRSAAPLGTLSAAGEDAERGEGRSDYKLTAADGGSLAVSEWIPRGETRLTLIAVHGFGDYGLSSFGEAAQSWAEDGIRTLAYDQRGFGRNPSRGDWPGAAALIDDLAAVHAHAKARGDAPIAVLGHSMGGAVVAAAIGEGRIAPDRAVLLAPALWGGGYLNPVFRGTAGLAAALFPDRRWTGRGVVRIQASDNIEMLRALGRDPLYLRNPSSREFLGLIRLMDRAIDGAGAITVPTLVLYGEKDEVVPEAPIRETAARMPGLVDYRRIDTGWHLLLRDLEAERVRREVAEFLLSEGFNGD